jgi:hypothetical protein
MRASLAVNSDLEASSHLNATSGRHRSRAVRAPSARRQSSGRCASSSLAVASCDSLQSISHSALASPRVRRWERANSQGPRRDRAKGRVHHHDPLAALRISPRGKAQDGLRPSLLSLQAQIDRPVETRGASRPLAQAASKCFITPPALVGLIGFARYQVCPERGRLRSLRRTRSCCAINVSDDAPRHISRMSGHNRWD